MNKTSLDAETATTATKTTSMDNKNRMKSTQRHKTVGNRAVNTGQS